MCDVHRLIKSIQKEEYVYIQTHDYPDNDAVASAYGLQKLLDHFGVTAYLVYEGKIQDSSLIRMINALSVSIRAGSQENIGTDNKIIIVDGYKGNKNISDLPGKEIAVIDHHEVQSQGNMDYIDIRDQYGACSSIIYSYYENLEISPPPSVATALCIGVLSDTALLTRQVSEYDIKTYLSLYDTADIRLVHSILRNKIQKKDLNQFRKTLERTIIIDKLAFCYFEDGCKENLLGIIGDFLLSMVEIEFVFLCARNDARISISVRSENVNWNASRIVQTILAGIGNGGGHADMAGGVIEDASLFDEDEMVYTISKVLGIESGQTPESGNSIRNE